MIIAWLEGGTATMKSKFTTPGNMKRVIFFGCKIGAVPQGESEEDFLAKAKAKFNAKFKKDDGDIKVCAPKGTVSLTGQHNKFVVEANTGDPIDVSKDYRCKKSDGTVKPVETGKLEERKTIKIFKDWAASPTFGTAFRCV